MRLHRNAKTTPLMRQLIVDRVMRQHWTQARAAEAAGVSVRTVTKWVARWRAGDLACLDAASRPHRQPRRLAVATVSQIVQLRQTRATAWQISTALQVPRSTVTRVLLQAGLNRLRVLEPRPVIRRYEWPHAGDLLHVDIKPLGRIRGIGHRMTGDRQRPQPGSGWEYVHVAIDDATRLAYVEVRRSQRRHACARFLRRALQWFARRGIRVHRVLTACYEQVVKALGAVGPSNRGTDTGSGSVEPAHRASSGLIPEERRVPGGSTSSCLRREELRTTVGMASSPVGAGASGFYAAIDSSLHTWSASNAVRFLTTANA